MGGELGEWVRWGVSMAGGAVVVWATMSARVKSLETDVTALKRELSQIRFDVGEIRGFLMGHRSHERVQ